MPRIYSNAIRVVVWLGHEEPWGLESTFQYINSLYQDDVKNEKINEEIHYGTSRVAAQLLRNEYWTRVWVIQEIVLAERVIVQCGKSVLDWNRLCHLIHASAQRSFFPATSTHLDEFEDLNGLRDSRLMPEDDFEPTPPEFRSRREANTQPDDPSMDILALCYSFRFRKSTEHRDKVFALLGLSNHSQGFLKVDYSRRESFLSIDLSTQHVCHSRNLSVLALAENTRLLSRHWCLVGGEPQLIDPSDSKSNYVPTWCPYFFGGTGGIDESLHLLWTGLRGEENSFSATGHAPIFVTPMHGEFQSETMDDHSLFHALRVHVLPDFSAKITHDDRSDKPDDEALNKILRIDKPLQATVRSMSGQTLPAERTLSEYAFRLRRSIRLPDTSYTRSSLNTNMSAQELLHLTLTTGKFSEYSASGSAASRKYREARREACYQRQLFVTSDGHLGLGPKTLRIGDELHLVLGMDVPVILRPASYEWRSEDEPYKSGWIYVGQAYVHELMRYEGDLVADIDCGRVKIEERVLV